MVPDLLAELDRTLASIGITLPPTARPLRFGTWAGGDRDGNPNITPAVTLEVLGLQHDFGLRELVRGVEELLQELSSSTRVVVISPELHASLDERPRGASDHLRRHQAAQRRGALSAQAELCAGPAPSAPATG